MRVLTLLEGIEGQRVCMGVMGNGGLLLHVDGGEGAVGNGAADGAGEGEARVQRDTAQFLCGHRCLNLLLHFLQLGAGLLRCRAHLADCVVWL